MRPVAVLVISALAVANVLAAGPPARRGTSVRGQATLAVQVRLDRAGFSPGEIDGSGGPNTTRAIEAFQRARGLPESGRPDAATKEALEAADQRDVLVDRTLSDEDVAGPWTPIPEDMMAQAMLPALGYTSPLERLAEQVHAAPALLRALNPGATFDRAGEIVRVPDVDEVGAAPSAPRPVRTRGEPAATRHDRPVAERASTRVDAVLVRVSKATSALTVTSADGAVVFHAPVTLGSEHDPLPLGEWSVTGVQRNPVFHYNPDLFWDADPAHARAVLRAGPNNPVGVVWIDLNREHYGLHGTPEPGLVGHATSHGCVRLTNWDALHVASLVARGTRVVFEE